MLGMRTAKFEKSLKPGALSFDAMFEDERSPDVVKFDFVTMILGVHCPQNVFNIEIEERTLSWTHNSHCMNHITDLVQSMIQQAGAINLRKVGDTTTEIICKYSLISSIFEFPVEQLHGIYAEV